MTHRVFACRQKLTKGYQVLGHCVSLHRLPVDTHRQHVYRTCESLAWFVAFFTDAGTDQKASLQVEHVATISNITPAESFEGFTFTFSNAAPILDDCHVGDSICVNGACLTVTEFDKDSFKVGLAPETLRRTNLGGSGRTLIVG